MTTMPYATPRFCSAQFDDIEENVELVRVGIKFANRSHFVVRVFWKAAMLNYAFRQAIEKQDRLIDFINGPGTQGFSTEELREWGAKIEHLVGLNDDLLAIAGPRTREYGPWMERLSQIRIQRDTLESIAQSFHSASDPEHQALLVATLDTMYA